MQFNQVVANLDRIDPFWTDMIHFGQFDPFWTDLIHFGQILSILDRFDPFWTDLIQSDEKKEVSFLSSCNTALSFLLNSRSVQSFVIMNCCQL